MHNHLLVKYLQSQLYQRRSAKKATTTDLDRSVSRRFGTLTDWSIDLGFDTFVFWPTTAPLAQLEVFATEVVPGVRQRVSERRGQP
jgi:hypothetical protein